MEKCSKCGAEAPSGTLARDTVDAAQIYCEKCRPAEPKKPRKPRKKKEEIVIAPAAVVRAPDPPPIPDDVLMKDAKEWATECLAIKQGVSSVLIHKPVRENYPRYGFGYVMQVMEVGGLERKATARYTSKGERSYWTIDGAVTG